MHEGRTPVSNAKPTNETPVAEATDGTKPLPREDRRQVVVDVLAIAVVDLLLEERSRVRGEHEAATC
jgi:hypothetical protein